MSVLRLLREPKVDVRARIIGAAEYLIWGNESANGHRVGVRPSLGVRLVNIGNRPSLRQVLVGRGGTNDYIEYLVRSEGRYTHAGLNLWAAGQRVQLERAT